MRSNTFDIDSLQCWPLPKKPDMVNVLLLFHATLNFMKVKKSLGQNFLQSEEALAKIVEAGEISASDIVFEIGPGTGNLTKHLLQTAGQVIAIEKDEALFTSLLKKFKKEIESGRLVLISGDILEYDENNLPRDYKLVANIPYYITGLIIKKFLSANHQPKLAVLLVQKEVAERIVVKDGKESILSLSVKAYATPRMVGIVEAEHFKPVPKVDSAILKLSMVPNSFFKDKKDEKLFFEIIHRAFAHKRKILLNNFLPEEREKIIEFLKNKKYSGNIRAEKLKLEDWKKVIDLLRR